MKNFFVVAGLVGSAVLFTFGAFAQNTAYGLDALVSLSTGVGNSAFGNGALRWNTTGINNSAFGHNTLTYNSVGSSNQAFGVNCLFSNTTGNSNSAFGTFCLYANSSGYLNHAFGINGLASNTTGHDNVALGSSPLFKNTDGSHNVGMGSNALFSNLTGNSNTAIGESPLYSNTTGYGNVAIGREVLYSNLGGRFNAAFGDWAMRANTTGFKNTAIGNNSLYANTTGIENTAVGNHALEFNTTGTQNVGVGNYAGFRNPANVKCTYLGHDANDSGTGSTYQFSTAIGAQSRITASNQVRLGSPTTTSVGGYTGWTILSDGRYKRDVQEDVAGLEFILQLRPVTYHLDIRKLNHDLGITGTPYADQKDGDKAPIGATAAAESLPGVAEKEAIRYTGFIAQEVEQAAQAVGYDFSGVDKPKNVGDHYGLRYDEFVVPLVKSVQEQQHLIEAQAQRIADLEQKLEQVMARLDDPASRIPSTHFTRLMLTPNPAASSLRVALVLEQAAEVQFHVSNAAGQVVLRHYAGRMEAGSQTLTLSVGELPAGQYFLQAAVGDVRVVEKFQVAR